MLESNALNSTRLQCLQETPLWDFALSLYGQPGAEAACLTLQEEAGVDVCELLFHCWLYSCGLEALPTAIARQRDECLQWQRSVTAVLRGLRRDLKFLAASSESVTALRETIKQAELMAERENLQRWQAWVWEAENSELIVAKVVEDPKMSAKWLQKKLFSNKADMPSVDDLENPLAVSEALQTLTYQLDPHQGAR